MKNLNNEIAELLKQAFIDGQNNPDSNPTYSNARIYAESALAALQAEPVTKPYPPADWDTYALEKARELWALPEMSKAQLIATIQCALLDAMAWAQAQPAKVPEKRHPVGGLDYGWKGEYNRGWNDCVDAITVALAAREPEPRPYWMDHDDNDPLPTPTDHDYKQLQSRCAELEDAFLHQFEMNRQLEAKCQERAAQIVQLARDNVQLDAENAALREKLVGSTKL